jgi:predicted O-methyltransferase YrrM
MERSTLAFQRRDIVSRAYAPAESTNSGGVINDAAKILQSGANNLKTNARYGLSNAPDTFPILSRILTCKLEKCSMFSKRAKQSETAHVPKTRHEQENSTCNFSGQPSSARDISQLFAVWFQEKISLDAADKVLIEIETKTKKKFLPIVGPHRGQALVETIRKNKPKRVLEIGTLIGYSAILMAKELESSAHLITIGINPNETKSARENIIKAKIAATIDVITGDAKEVIPKLSGKFDMVFIDAEKTESLQYLQLAEPKLHKGSIIIADNAGTHAHEMKDYLNYVRSSGKYSSQYVPVDEDGLEISTTL